MKVRLLPHSPDHLRALLKSPAEYEEKSGYPIAEGVREFLGGPEVSESFQTRVYDATAADAWRDGFGVLLPEENRVIGLASFHGPPDTEGMVEISYAIAPGYIRRGYATEAAQSLLDYAVASGEVRTVRAHTTPEENASTRILRRCGFKMEGAIEDPEDGLIWRWTLPVP